MFLCNGMGPYSQTLCSGPYFSLTSSLYVRSKSMHTHNYVLRFSGIVGSIDCEIQPEEKINFYCFLLFWKSSIFLIALELLDQFKWGFQHTYLSKCRALEANRKLKMSHVGLPTDSPRSHHIIVSAFRSTRFVKLFAQGVCNSSIHYIKIYDKNKNFLNAKVGERYLMDWFFARNVAYAIPNIDTQQPSYFLKIITDTQRRKHPRVASVAARMARRKR